MKASSTDDQSLSEAEAYVLPLTPIYQPDQFGAIEPATGHVTSDFEMPLSEYKWNQIVDLELPDGKKV